MQLVFFNPTETTQFHPITLTRPLADVRIGIFTIAEKWQRDLGMEVSFLASDGFAQLYPSDETEDNLYIAGNVLPTEALISLIQTLEPGESITYEGTFIAFRGADFHISLQQFREYDQALVLQQPIDLLAILGSEIHNDLERVRRRKLSQKVTDPATVLYNEPRIFLEEGVDIKNATLDATNGPIYLGEKVQIGPGAVIEGPCALGEGTHVMPNTHIRAGAGIGPGCVVGGELKRVLMQEYSNKGHYGYLGDSIIGAFCNFGAGTTGSNLKNNYGTVSVFDYQNRMRLSTGQMKFGMLMGDYVHTAIGTLITTGSSIGTGSHVYGEGLLGPSIPPFSWGMHDKYALDRFCQLAKKVRELKGQEFTEAHLKFLEALWETYQFETPQSWE